MSYYGEIGTYTPDSLIAGENVPFLIKGVTLVSGQGVLKRGSVIGIISASGNGKLVSTAASDGSQTAKYILADDIDTTSEVVAQCYSSGLFNRQALTFGEGDDASDHEDSLRHYGIYLKDNINY